MKLLFLILMFAIGAIIGSFVTCQAWRVRYKELGKKKLGKRSVCLHCGYKLKWKDNIPIISWLMLGGKCRKCHKKIGSLELIAEIFMGLTFLGVATTIDLNGATLSDWGVLLVNLLFISSLGFLAVYDGKWGELPNFGLLISGILAVLLVLIRQDGLSWNLIGSVLILGGVYLVLYVFSKGKWVGNGDFVLGTILGVALGNAWLALITLFIANLSGCLIMLPSVAKKKSKKIYFGPFLVVGYIIAVVFANFFMNVI